MDVGGAGLAWRCQTLALLAPCPSRPNTCHPLATVMPVPDLPRLLTDGLHQLNVSLSADQQALLLRYVDELTQWNRAYNLTAVREPAEMISRHLLDSLAVAAAVQGEQVLDVGAGAGLPGIVLAIAQPTRHFIELDSNGKKVRFMRHAVRTLGLSNVDIVHSRLEAYRPAQPPDCILARAFTATESLLSLVAPICRVADTAEKGTQILAMRGKDEPVQLPPGYRQLENRALKVPRSTAPRHLLIVERV